MILKNKIALITGGSKGIGRAIAQNPMKRVGKSEEVAAVALFLASDEAGYVTGGMYTVDGGESLK